MYQIKPFNQLVSVVQPFGSSLLSVKSQILVYPYSQLKALLKLSSITIFVLILYLNSKSAEMNKGTFVFPK